ncbi:MAG: C69 family dipeptidase, partial [Clostridium sp.]|nr:C69 family dipeptidase [Clostridium sp.]
DPMRYTAVPNADDSEGVWGAAGVNAANISMTATETLTSNDRVLSADPLVTFCPAEDGKAEKPGGIGEEDIITLVLPYIRSAREGVLRLGSLLEQYGTYEMNGIAFQDLDEVWWLETVGGHHWIAKRVPDDAYVVMPNQLGIDSFDLGDAFGEKKEHLCSPDMREFIRDNFLDLSLDGRLNPRDAFGSHSDSDHVYNTPRAWYIQRFFNPHGCRWEGPGAELGPESDDIPWARVPERKLTPEDVKYVLSNHFQGTPYDVYASHGDLSLQGLYRPTGINRNNFLSLVQLRPYRPRAIAPVIWLAFASNVFNSFVPFYTCVEETPAFLGNATTEVSTDNFYWANRLIGAMADAHFGPCLPHIEHYQSEVLNEGHGLIKCWDKKITEALHDGSGDCTALCMEANREIETMLKKKTAAVLAKVLDEASRRMKNSFSRADS